MPFGLAGLAAKSVRLLMCFTRASQPCLEISGIVTLAYNPRRLTQMRRSIPAEEVSNMTHMQVLVEAVAIGVDLARRSRLGREM
jgi:hypothetical protein